MWCVRLPIFNFIFGLRTRTLSIFPFCSCHIFSFSVQSFFLSRIYFTANIFLFVAFETVVLLCDFRSFCIYLWAAFIFQFYLFLAPSTVIRQQLDILYFICIAQPQSSLCKTQRNISREPECLPCQCPLSTITFTLIYSQWDSVG